MGECRQSTAEVGFLQAKSPLFPLEFPASLPSRGGARMGRRQKEAHSGLHAQRLPGRPCPTSVRPFTPGRLRARVLSRSGSDSSTLWTVPRLAPLCLLFFRQEHWSGCVQLGDPMDCSRQAPVPGFSRQELAFFSRDLPCAGSNLSHALCISRRAPLPPAHLGSPIGHYGENQQT